MAKDFYEEGRPLGREGLFQLVSDEVFQDGVVEPWENAILQKLSRFLRLDARESLEIAQRSREKFASGELGESRPLDPLSLYLKVLTCVYEDGRVDLEEEQMLIGLRIMFNLTDSMHEGIVARVRAEHRGDIRVESSEIHAQQSTKPSTVAAAGELVAAAGVMRERGQIAQGIDACKRAIQVIEELASSESEDMAQALLELAQLHRDCGDWSQAEPICARAVGICERVLGADHPAVAQSMVLLAQIYGAQSNHVLAEQKYQQAVAIYERINGAEHPTVASALNQLGEVYRAWDRWEAAEEAFSRALDIRFASLGPAHPETLSTQDQLVWLCRKRGHLARNEEIYERSIAGLEAKLGPDDPLTLKHLLRLGYLHEKQGEPDKAAPLYKAVLDSRELTLGPNDLLVADVLADQARLHAEHGNFWEAGKLFRRALDIRRSHLDAGDIVVLATLEGYTHALRSIPDVKSLVELLNEPNAMTRLYAVRTLGEVGPEAKAAIPALKFAVKDDDPAVRTAAEKALARVDLPEEPQE